MSERQHAEIPDRNRPRKKTLWALAALVALPLISLASYEAPAPATTSPAGHTAQVILTGCIPGLNC